METSNISKSDRVNYLYRYFDEQDRLLYVGISLSAVNRLAQHKKTADWVSMVRRITIEPFENRAAALAAERIAIGAENPLFNIQGKKADWSLGITVPCGVESDGEPFIYLTPEVLKLFRTKKRNYLEAAFAEIVATGKSRKSKAR